MNTRSETALTHDNNIFLPESARILASVFKVRSVESGVAPRNNGGNTRVKVLSRRIYRVAVATKKIRFENP